MRLLKKKPEEIRAHELTLAHKLVTDQGTVSIREIRNVSSYFDGPEIEVITEAGGRSLARQFGWTEKVKVV